MLSIQDLLDYCDLDRGEIEAIAAHEHIPMAIAAELSECLLASPEGVCRLHTMILENLREAIEDGQGYRVQGLMETYEHLQRTHPLPLH